MHGLKKLLRDLWSSRGRTLTMLIAVSVGLAGMNAVFGAYGILTREIRRNYVATVPASATLELDRVSPHLLAKVRERPEIAAAVRRKTVHARYRTSPEGAYGRALVFVIDDFSRMPIAKVFKERGAWPPPLGTALIERSALSRLGGGVGSSFLLKTPGGQLRALRVSGVVHDPALAPANTEQAIYAYVTPETLSSLGEPAIFDELRVLVRERQNDRAAIEGVARRLADWVEKSGLGHVHRIKVPPPNQHPHSTQMTTVLALLSIFSALVLLLSSILTASLMTTLMARQVREIGILKALGATSLQIGSLYVLMISALAVTAFTLAWVPGELGARACSSAVAKVLNFDLESLARPNWVTAAGVVIGLSMPVLVTLPTIWRGSRITAREAMADYGVGNPGFGERRLDRWLSRAAGARALFAFAVRNALRRRSRFILAFGLLTAAGGAFISAMSVAEAWKAVARVLENSRHYDAVVRFNRPEPIEPLVQRLTALPSVTKVEAWGRFPTSVAQNGRIPVETTYPDASHGAFNVFAPPPGSTMLDVELVAGRWLTPDDRDAIVVNQGVPGATKLNVGDALTLSIEGRPRAFVIAGKIAEVGMGATAYISAQAFDTVIAAENRNYELRIAATDAARFAQPELMAEIDRELTQASASVRSVLPLTVFQNAVAAHFEVLVNALLALAALTGIVGALGLSSAMSANVVERTRELGVLFAIGASRAQVRNALMLEGLFIGALSTIGAVVLGILLALTLGSTIGQLSFKLPLPLVLSGPALAIWTITVLSLSALATFLPSLSAQRMTVRAALTAV